VTRRDDGSFLLDATLPITDTQGLLALKELPPGDFLTLAGFVLSQLAHIPKIGEHVDWGSWRLSVISMDGRRIDQILAQPLSIATVDRNLR
jgi:putative hemolysin